MRLYFFALPFHSPFLTSHTPPSPFSLSFPFPLFQLHPLPPPPPFTEQSHCWIPEWDCGSSTERNKSQLSGLSTKNVEHVLLCACKAMPAITYFVRPCVRISMFVCSRGFKSVLIKSKFSLQKKHGGIGIRVIMCQEINSAIGKELGNERMLLCGSHINKKFRKLRMNNKGSNRSNWARNPEEF